MKYSDSAWHSISAFSACSAPQVEAQNSCWSDSGTRWSMMKGLHSPPASPGRKDMVPQASYRSDAVG